MKYLETIIGSGILTGVRKKDYIEAFEQFRVIGRNMHKGDVIFHEDDIIDRICIINSGSVRSEKTYMNGEVHIMQIYDEMSIFGLESAVSKLKTSPADYICNEDSTIISISMKAIEKSNYHNIIVNTIMELLADDNIKKMRKIEILAQKGLRDRVLLYLSILSGKANSNRVHVKMNREQMAQYLCVNRSALSNELNKMKREGVLDFKKGEFKILQGEFSQTVTRLQRP